MLNTFSWTFVIIHLDQFLSKNKTTVKYCDHTFRQTEQIITEHKKGRVVYGPYSKTLLKDRGQELIVQQQHNKERNILVYYTLVTISSPEDEWCGLGLLVQMVTNIQYI